MNVKEKLIAALREKETRMIDIRRYLHQHPELSFHETETAKYIANFYIEKGLDVEVETDVNGEHGVIVTIDSGKPGKTLAIRADFDALPIEEETELPFASENKGVMHACGHDGHTAYMLVLAETLAEMKEELHGKIKVFHQPAEETPPGGAIGMIKAGCLDGVDNVVGIHVISTAPFGKVLYCEGEMHSARSFFKLTIEGKGGHGSSPHVANDAIVAGSYFVTILQTIISRRINPFDMGVVTIGSFDGAGSFNVIKDKVTLDGDVRAMSEKARSIIDAEIKQICDGLEVTFGVKCRLEYTTDYPVVYNDPTFTRQVVDILKNTKLDGVDGIEQTVPQPPSEDFAYFAEKVPSTFIHVGGQVEDKPTYFHHHPKFDFNEKALLVCAEVMGSIVVDYLNEAK
ncbi:amidohydrolase [Enterococcus rivorum]|uniref:Amidohydrolase n=1 Tax=Enterococcus rivorum TaxID=762845 RepID=A0A1E5KYK8_9ENTE|nr:amidohydrolase [Enterococcus rivorum]MBP2097515.1 amidohydrolase [Enterococcus rivorum]OEH82971.1 amidohydrolase [Enterococcus rivorum]